MGVALRSRRPGVAYPFAVHLERQRLLGGLSKTDLAAKAGISRTTLDNIGFTSVPPQQRTVLALADAVGMDREEAAQMAGLLAPEVDDASAPVRQAILDSDAYSPAQKSMLLDLIGVIDQANRKEVGHTGTPPAHEAI
jgi:DNA-binding XRE family transcriptional regulator